MQVIWCAKITYSIVKCKSHLMFLSHYAIRPSVSAGVPVSADFVNPLATSISISRCEKLYRYHLQQSSSVEIFFTVTSPSQDVALASNVSWFLRKQLPFQRILLIRWLRVSASSDARNKESLSTGWKHPYTQKTGDEWTSPVTEKRSCPYSTCFCPKNRTNLHI